MNILMLHSSSGLYGSGKILKQTADVLRSEGHSITVILSEEGPLSDQLRSSGTEVIILRLGIIRRKYFSMSGIINRLWVSVKAYRSLKKICKEKKVDLIYSNTTAVMIGCIVAHSLKLKHIWHVHEIVTRPRIIKRSIGILLKKYGQRIIAVSNAVAEHWNKYIDKKNLIIIYNGINDSLFINPDNTFRKELGIRDDRILIGMIGMIHPCKGQNYFLHIANEISKKYSFVDFVMVGDTFKGYEYINNELENLKLNLNIKSNVYTLGFREDIPRILKGLDIFVLPSTMPDSFPTVILEAMASSIPVIATNQGGAPEMIVNNETGLLIPLNNEKEVAKIIKPLILDKKLRKDMGEKGNRRLKEKFSFEAFNDAIAEVIK